MNRIYLITNLINNKKYIGITTQSIEKRWYYHCRSYSECPYIKNSIQKYGKENFKIEEIFNTFTFEYLLYFESQFINFYNTLYPNGYNLNTGGTSPIFSQDTLDKLKVSNKLSWNNERKEKYSNLMKERHKNKDPSLRIGVDKYIEEKKTPVIGISIYDGSILRFPTNCEARKNSYYPDGCLINRDLYSNGYCWFYDEGFPETYYIQETLKKLGGKFRVDIRNGIKSVDKKSGEVKEYSSLDNIKEEGLHDVLAVQAVLRGSRKSYHGKFWEARL